ncbi:DUF2911 domain-containing protein [Polaribacter batillariae]|uniref:DUF2911 domain-containing protein n=1 Tax=Polaribacter batillariae TaxID=2808900 RepID=A0ABX7SQV5_9FLAO|nr:DUF2911 domain-containing protein [Polaribacter batillariae]QTD36602.1 DUF2911 domain-containing protein [Polaribacter batillariae]
MKKSIVSLIVFAIALISTNEAFAQKFPKMDVSPMDAASYPNNWRDANKLVKVIYSRPQLKGRDLGKLAPKDKVWRTGANEAAEITFYKKLKFGGKEVKPGTYTLFTIPQEESWTVILSNQKNIWGAYFYDKKQDVLRVPAKVSKSNNNIEAFSIAFDGEKDNIKMHMGWGNTVVTVPIAVEKAVKESEK